MKLTHSLFLEPIDFRENQNHVLIVESPTQFKKIVFELYCQVEGGEGGFVLSSEGNILEMSRHAKLLSDFHHFSLNEKKMLNSLQNLVYEYFLKEAQEDYHILESQLLLFANNLCHEFDFHISAREKIEGKELLKLYQFQFLEKSQNLNEKLMDYIKASQWLTLHKLFIFVGLKNYLEADELQDFYHYCNQNKADLLLIEGTIRDKVKGEIIHILDQDLCYV